MRLPPFNPRLAIAIAICATSTTAILVRLAGDIPASIITQYRFLGALLIMIPIVLYKYRKEFRMIKTTDWITLLLGGVFLAAHFILWFESFQQTSIMSTVFIVGLHPILLLIASAFIFKERFSLGTSISILIALIGGAIIIFGDLDRSASLFKGDLFAVAAMLTLVVYYLLGSKTRKHLSLITYLSIVSSFALVTIFIFNIVNKVEMTSYAPKQWLLFLLLATVPNFLGVFLFSWSLKWIKTATVSLGMLVEPIAASLLAYFIFSEQVSPTQWVGGTILFFGLYLFIISTSRKTIVTISKKQ